MWFLYSSKFCGGILNATSGKGKCGHYIADMNAATCERVRAHADVASLARSDRSNCVEHVVEW